MKTKQRKLGRKLLSFLLTLVMLVELIPGMSLTAYAEGTAVDLSTLTGNYTATDGDVLSGTASGKTVTIPAGATVTLNGVNISSGSITCSGSVTMILIGANTVTATDYIAAIKIGGSGTTLTITGSGSLTAQGGKSAAGIGTDRNGTGGNIVINGGTVTATGGKFGAGIGTGRAQSGSSTCGDITINGGTVTATGGSNGGAGIGTGLSLTSGGSNTCGAITIGTGVTMVTATKGSDAPNSIGNGQADFGGTQTCGTITIGGDATTYAAGVTTSPFTYATHSVTITAGDNMTTTGNASQTGLSGAMADVVYTAADGYYFPENYVASCTVTANSGVSVTRDSYTQITVSGTPTADAEITLPAPTAKTTPDAPTTAAAVDCTTADNNDGKLTGVTTAMEYKKSDAESWTGGTGSDITGLVPGTYYVRVKATDTTNASTNQELTIKGKEFISYTVTFKVVNGKWNEGEGDDATADKIITLTGHDGDTLKLTADQIPAVGTKPNDTYKAGSWDTEPSTYTAITADTTYTYTYAQKDSISQTVTFKVANGKWDDDTTADKTVTLTGYEGDMLKLTADQIPAVGTKPNDTYKAGSWDTTPSTDTEITAATTYTYTYAAKEASVVTKAPEAKTLTYNGSAQELVTAGTATGGTMQYAIGTKDAATEPYATSIPTATNAGTYYVWYKVTGDADHNDSAAVCVKVVISEEGSGKDDPTPSPSPAPIPVPAANVSGNDTVSIKKLELNVKGTQTLSVGEEATIKAAVTGKGSDASLNSVNWVAPSGHVVVTEVQADGSLKVKAVGPGTAFVTAVCGGKAKTVKYTVKQPVNKAEASLNAITLSVKEKYRICVNLDAPTTDKFFYVTNDKKVCAVNGKGIIAAKGSGTTTVDILAGEKKKTAKKVASITVTVKEGVAAAVEVKDVSINYVGNKTLYTGEMAYISTLVNGGANNGGQAVKYSFSTKGIVKIDAYGRLTAKKAGKVTVTASCGGKETSVELTVQQPLKTLKVNKTYVKVKQGKAKTVTLSVKTSPALNKSDIKAVWSVANEGDGVKKISDENGKAVFEVSDAAKDTVVTATVTDPVTGRTYTVNSVIDVN